MTASAPEQERTQRRSRRNGPRRSGNGQHESPQDAAYREYAAKFGRMPPEQAAAARVKFNAGWQAEQEAQAKAKQAAAALGKAHKAAYKYAKDAANAAYSHFKPRSEGEGARGGGSEETGGNPPHTEGNRNRRESRGWTDIADLAGAVMFSGAVSKAKKWYEEKVPSDVGVATRQAWTKVAGQLTEHFPEAGAWITNHAEPIVKAAEGIGTNYLTPETKRLTTLGKGLLIKATGNPVWLLAPDTILAVTTSKAISKAGSLAAGTVHAFGSGLEFGGKTINAIKTGASNLQAGLQTQVESLQQGFQGRVDAAVNFIKNPFQTLTPQPQPIKV
ncbi:MAG: hypothetical protein UV61_C0017G0023 [Candidatus Gottesmanbacteria bacterium GW2011_GWB1_43_11]|uniref:Uncharacterized protein n=1 Tax=Candidatus Gottesmanbacteria bacterium GW2011_GWB1_43_11 TaxID=1618446 RepID=A0A0G1CJ38_9BACT|nr:MAG: hypothetical protein UV04_C0017G0016 [Candidatus Gottesmanbacteria bacterium GW2011_GWA2_42_16]KKS54424.1 MAG: hypothetical protein UV17_C0019G0021 [Candidatus Gottesmanbacteria bacterium GW2011_GWA1_42_26]KKS85512.1 MAG: hypothetical protein UV61_C0017G0023 [Candidatus Gottesmanbacteria bacterium GW2011_GWB1_43_11]OGG10663.1 MAG: hypothetical protein A2699_02570 [Candidatus Gottesmanbacteria bacterium RIFCSPHIGHO2_01_FULL_43_15]OGG27391.1 MAG: hypothetical protein A3A59_06040 [Candidat